MARFLILFTCLFIFSGQVRGQAIEWVVSGGIDDRVAEKLPASVSPYGDFKSAIEAGLTVMQNNGYLLAHVEKTAQREETFSVYINAGNLFKWTRLDGGNLPLQIQNRVGFRPGRYELTPVSKSNLELLFERILKEAERNGHPFAKVRLDSIEMNGTNIRAVINYTEGALVRYGVLSADSSFVKTGWLAAYLDLRPGDPYDQRVVENMAARMDALEFAGINGSPTIRFIEDRADIYLPVERRPANRIDAIVGFLPNEESDGGMRITGEAELHLANLFNSGKVFDLHWQRMRPETQYLDLGYFHPNIFRTNLNISVGFDLLKEDTTFITRDFDLRVDYRTGRHVVSFMSRLRAARILNEGLQEDLLPSIGDFNQNDYGAGYMYDRIDAGWLGFKGLRLSAEFMVGNKRIRNASMAPDDGGSDRNILQLTSTGGIRWGFLTGKRTLLFQNFRAGWLESDQLFVNDLYRLGGFRTIRGFNENQFFAQQYLLYSAEWQLYFDDSSNLMVFLDQAFFSTEGLKNNPTGIGVGLTLQTGGGLLQLAYAVGRDMNNAFDFRLSKFHFGYKAKF